MNESREGFCRRGRGRSFRVDGPKTEKVREPTVEESGGTSPRNKIKETADTHFRPAVTATFSTIESHKQSPTKRRNQNKIKKTFSNILGRFLNIHFNLFYMLQTFQSSETKRSLRRPVPLRLTISLSVEWSSVKTSGRLRRNIVWGKASSFKTNTVSLSRVEL